MGIGGNGFRQKEQETSFPIFGNKKTGVDIPFLFQTFQQQKIIP